MFAWNRLSTDWPGVCGVEPPELMLISLPGFQSNESMVMVPAPAPVPFGLNWIVEAKVGGAHMKANPTRTAKTTFLNIPTSPEMSASETHTAFAITSAGDNNRD